MFRVLRLYGLEYIFLAVWFSLLRFLDCIVFWIGLLFLPVFRSYFVMTSFHVFLLELAFLILFIFSSFYLSL